MTSNWNRTAIRTRGQGLVLRALILALLVGTASPRRVDASHARSGIRDLIPEFNAICTQLDQSRRALASGALNEDEFVDRILDLFVRTDSLGVILNERSRATAKDLGTFALDRSIRYLKSSLRENYEGIVGRNGYRFVSADVALRAAEAWRNAITLPEAASP